MSSPRFRAIVDGRAVEIDIEPGESLLSVLRERLGATSVKDGCAPQGQCGCCTVLIDGQARVACVTPAARADGRVVTTVDGLDPRVRDSLVGAFVECGASQCGFCTPGIVTRLAALVDRNARPTRPDLDRALAAHLCRCTGWQTIYEAVERRGDVGELGGIGPAARGGALGRAQMEGNSAQSVDTATVLGRAGFADDNAPAAARVAIPRPPGSDADAIAVDGVHYVVADSLDAARALVGKVQGRRTTVPSAPPFAVPAAPPGGVALATSWVEPAYLEPDASWCVPGGEPASPLGNGGAFGGKCDSPAPLAARTLADQLGATVRVVFAREDVVRFGPKRPPMAATAVLVGDIVRIEGVYGHSESPPPLVTPYSLAIDASWRTEQLVGPAVSTKLRASGWAEQSVLVEGALFEAGIDRATLLTEDRARAVLLESCVRAPSGALAGAAVYMDDRGGLERIEIRVEAGDPLDAAVLRSYCIGAAHMALGWVLTESLSIDSETGEVFDLTIRSFGIVRPRDVPPIDVTIIVPSQPTPALAGGSDAAFAAVAASLWNALAVSQPSRPATFPALDTPLSKRLRRA